MNSLKTRITQHYDALSTYYLKLWGRHIHHGYWITGKESKEEAQENLIELLIKKAEVKKCLRVLDVGCGIGGSSVYLAKKYQAQVTGITISSEQVLMTKEFAQQNDVDVNFLLMDADNIALKDTFDVIWSIEAISHFQTKQKFFNSLYPLSKKGGKVVITDWFKAEEITESQQLQYIEPIEKGMLLPALYTIGDYCTFLTKAGFKVTAAEDLSKNVAKSWDISVDIIKNPELWKLALQHGKDFVSFMKTFEVMRKGFSSKTFVYGLIVAEKI